ncbi:MAG TPA: sugar phosphate isomerase/epimerase family protein [Lacipirellulaceae bacterium]|jgi:sugar phosphate isomerase/epimerase|nr:sugar phosphate isomerase/epimerase family protein [Lacipirellulaceae bacterium]
MQLGFVSAIFGDLPLEEVLAFAGGEGYQCVEVMCWPSAKVDRPYGGVCHIDVTGFTQAQADDIRAQCEKHRVTISALGYYANALSEDANEAHVTRNHFRKVIDAAPLLGLKNVNGFIGANRHQPLEENLKQFEQVWPDIIRHAEDRGIKIGIENCPMLMPYTWPFGVNLARSPAIWRHMFEKIPSPNFGLNLDPSHLVMQLMDPVAPIREFGPRIFHTHAKDMRIDRHLLNDVGSLVPPMSRSTAKIPGLGDVPWGQWVGALTDAGYDGPVCVEVEDEAPVFHGTLEGRKRSLRISRNVLQPLIA